MSKEEERWQTREVSASTTAMPEAAQVGDRWGRCPWSTVCRLCSPRAGVFRAMLQEIPPKCKAKQRQLTARSRKNQIWRGKTRPACGGAGERVASPCREFSSLLHQILQGFSWHGPGVRADCPSNPTSQPKKNSTGPKVQRQECLPCRDPFISAGQSGHGLLRVHQWDPSLWYRCASGKTKWADRDAPVKSSAQFSQDIYSWNYINSDSIESTPQNLPSYNTQGPG